MDLQHNALEGEEALGALQGMRNARVLYLQGNRLPNYRRRLITALQDLSYLDDRPVEVRQRGQRTTGREETV